MDIEYSGLIEKIVGLKRKPVQVVGYLSPNGTEPDSLRLYPELDPTRYFVIPKKCVFHVQPAPRDSDERVRVFLDPTCEIECVSKEHRLATEINGCLGKSPCGCAPPNGTVSIPRIRETIMGIVRFLLLFGVKEFTCQGYGSSVTVGCCQAWNKLLAAVDRGESGWSELEVLVASCPYRDDD
jgi:hypothetical protein